MRYNIKLVKKHAVNYWWNINGQVIVYRFETKEEVEQFLLKVKNILLNRDSLINMVNKYTHTTIINTLIKIFPDIFIDYVYDIACDINKRSLRKLDKNNERPAKIDLYKKILTNKILGKNVIYREHREFEKLIDEVIVNSSFNIRFQNLKTLGHNYIKNRWDIKKYSNRKHGDYYKWNINGQIISFLGVRYSTKEMIELFLNEVFFYLKKQEKLDYLLELHSMYLIAEVSGRIFPDILKRYLEEVVRQFTKKRELIDGQKISRRIFKYEGKKIFPKRYNEILKSVIKKGHKKQLQTLVNNNQPVNFDDDVWILYYKRESSIKSCIFDFSQINRSNIKKEIKSYMLNKIEKRPIDDMSAIYENFISLKRGMIALLELYDINYCAEIDINIAKNTLSYLLNETKYAPASVSLTRTQMKKLIKFVQNNYIEIKTIRPQINPFDNITLKNIEDMKKNTDYIPDEIANKIIEHIDYLNEDYRRMLLIMLNVGLHFKDVIHLKEGCCWYDEENDIYVLKYIQWKNLKRRIREGKNEYIQVPIFEEIAQEVFAQSEKTKNLREEYGIEELFIHEYRGMIKNYENKGFNKAVNKLIKKFNIYDSDGKLWTFTSRQCRKTLAVDMAEKGATHIEIANYLGHDNIRTTYRYYEEVRKKRLADMNSKFWEKEFEVMVPEEHLKNFTEEQRKLLFMDFKLQIREVELGYCIKQVWEGPCGLRQGKINCATCNKLCTGLKYLEKWEKLKKSQEETVNRLEYMYSSLGVKNYSKYRDYQREKYVLDAYIDVINKIKQKFGVS